MSGARLYAVTVALRDQDSTHALLSLVSVLHRRAVQLGQADLSPASQGRRTFNATFTATDQQAATVRASLDNLVEALEVILAEATESSHIPTLPFRMATCLDRRAIREQSLVSHASHTAVPPREIPRRQAHPSEENS